MNQSGWGWDLVREVLEKPLLSFGQRDSKYKTNNNNSGCLPTSSSTTSPTPSSTTAPLPNFAHSSSHHRNRSRPCHSSNFHYCIMARLSKRELSIREVTKGKERQCRIREIQEEHG